MGIDPRAREGVHESVDILGVGAGRIKVKAPHRDGTGAQIMVRLVRGLERRVGKHKEKPAQKDADGALIGKAAGKAAHKHRCQQADFKKGHAAQRDR